MERFKNNLKNDYGLDDNDISINESNGNIIVTIDGSQIKVDKNGNIIDLENTDIYVTLYTDGSLVFSNNDSTIGEKDILQSFGNIKEQSFSSTRI